VGAYIEASNIASIAAQKLASGAVEQATSIASAFVSQLALKSVVYEIGKQVLIGTLRETVEEIVVDGLFETAIQSAVRMVGGPNDMGHWISTLFTSARESMNFASITGHFGSQTQQTQGFAGQVQTAMGLSTDFQAIVGEMMVNNIGMDLAQVAVANEQFLTAQMAEIGLIGETLQESKISIGRLLATGIFTGLSLLTPSLAGFNIYGASKLLGGVGNKIDAKIQNMFLAARNSKMLLKSADEFEKQEVEMGKKPIVSQTEDIKPENMPEVSSVPEGINPLIGRNPIELELGGRAALSSGFAMLDPFGRLDQGDDDTRNAAYFERKQQEVRDAQATINYLERVEKAGNILKQQYEAKQKIFDDIELFGFNPQDPNLKYPLTDYDNIQSILFKTMLNLIYKNKKILESIYDSDNQDFGLKFYSGGTFTRPRGGNEDSIAASNIGAILGGLNKMTINDMLKTIDSNSQKLTFTSEHYRIIRSIRGSTEQIFDHIELKDTQLIFRGLLDNYIEYRYTGAERFVMQFCALIDDYTDFGILSEEKMSNKLSMSLGYLQAFRSQKSYEHINKYLNLMVNIYISGEFNLEFTDSNKFEDFKKKLTSLVYTTLTGNTMIKETHTSKKRFDAICLTLTALTNLRYHISRFFPKYGPSTANPKAYYTLADLSSEISGSDYVGLLRNQLRFGPPSPQLFNIIEMLNLGISNNMDGCSLARHKIEAYLKSKQWTTQEFGFIFHPIYQQFSIEYLELFSIRAAHEKYVTYLENTKPDITIERKSKAERRSGAKSNFEVYIEDRQNILTIPDEIILITVDFTYVSDWATLKQKLDKYYQSDDRLLIIVLVGQKSDRTIQKLNDKLKATIKKDDGSNHYENIRIISSEQYGEFLGLGFDRDYERVYEEIQDATFNIFHDVNTLFGAMFLKRQAEWWLSQHNAKEDWINIYIPQQRS